MKLIYKLSISYSVLTILLIVLSCIGYWDIVTVDRISDEISTNSMPSSIGLLEMKEAQTAQQRTERTWIMNGLVNPNDNTQTTYNLNRIERQNKNYNDGYQRYIRLSQTKEESELWKQYELIANERKVLFEKIISLCKDSKYLDAYNLSIGESRIKYTQLENILTKLEELNEEYALESIYKQNVIAKECIMFLISISIFGILVSILLSIFITKNIINQIGIDPNELIDITKNVANGDLTSKLKHKNNNSILSNMIIMIDNLKLLVERTVENTNILASTSNQLHCTSEQIATSTEEIASQSNTIATASVEMSATSTDIAHNCQNASINAKVASDTANSGSIIVKETIEGIQQIAIHVSNISNTLQKLGTSSEEIGEIVKTIEDIADQTSLLSLNAAIEAARSGEAGRGFAVVADEVKKLAERTTNATTKIGTMITNIQSETKNAIQLMDLGVKQVTLGTESSLKSGKALDEILKQINEVAIQINQIAVAIEEQSSTTNEITNNINEITDVLHQSTKGISEIVNVSLSLSQTSKDLQTSISKFKL